MTELEILFEDRDILVAVKPEGVESEAARGLAPDMVNRIRNHLSVSGKEPYVAVIQRLDKPVTGIMVFAKNKESAAALSRELREGGMKKKYRAILCGQPKEKQGSFSDWLVHETKGNVTRCGRKGEPGAKECTGLGIAPSRIGEVFGIFKAYCTRVGAGPFPTELFDETGARLRDLGHEYGAVTGRERRCGWLDMVALKYAIMIDGVTQLIMMKSDVMNDFDTIRVATAYEIGGGTNHPRSRHSHGNYRTSLHVPVRKICKRSFSFAPVRIPPYIGRSKEASCVSFPFRSIYL